MDLYNVSKKEEKIMQQAIRKSMKQKVMGQEKQESPERLFSQEKLDQMKKREKEKN